MRMKITLEFEHQNRYSHDEIKEHMELVWPWNIKNPAIGIASKKGTLSFKIELDDDDKIQQLAQDIAGVCSQYTSETGVGSPPPSVQL